jgi:hypothetical protein
MDGLPDEGVERSPTPAYRCCVGPECYMGSDGTVSRLALQTGNWLSAWWTLQLQLHHTWLSLLSRLIGNWQGDVSIAVMANPSRELLGLLLAGPLGS